MESTKITLSFGTSTPRDEAIQSLVDLAQENNIDILNSRMFSNLSLVIEIECNVFGILSLSSALARVLFRITEASQEQIDKLAVKDSASPVHGTIQVSFAAGDGSLIIPVPMVPG